MDYIKNGFSQGSSFISGKVEGIGEDIGQGAKDAYGKTEQVGSDAGQVAVDAYNKVKGLIPGGGGGGGGGGDSPPGGDSLPLPAGIPKDYSPHHLSAFTGNALVDLRTLLRQTSQGANDMEREAGEDMARRMDEQFALGLDQYKNALSAAEATRDAKYIQGAFEIGSGLAEGGFAVGTGFAKTDIGANRGLAAGGALSKGLGGLGTILSAGKEYEAAKFNAQKELDGVQAGISEKQYASDQKHAEASAEIERASRQALQDLDNTLRDFTNRVQQMM